MSHHFLLFSAGLNVSSRLARGAGLHVLAKRVAPKTYGRWRTWRDYHLFKTKVLKGYRLIDTAELQREQVRAVEWLLSQGGPEGIGDYFEFGVFYGTSLLSMYRVLERFGLRQVRLFGFDSWEGLPAPEHPDDTFWKEGAYKSDYRFTCEYLTKEGVDWKQVRLTKGFFSDTLTEEFRRTQHLDKASLIMIDCDMYLSAKEALDYCAPHIKDRAIIFFDDWNAGELAERGQGEKRAFDEFLAENPDLVAEEFGSYCSEGRPYAKVFKVVRR